MQDEINEQVIPMFSQNHQSTDTILHARELGTIIEEALSKIPFDYRMVFSLREMNEMNLAETADLLNISEANVKVRLSRAKMMLRSEIEKSYSSKELYEFNLIYCNTMVEKVMKKINEL